MGAIPTDAAGLVELVRASWPRRHDWQFKADREPAAKLLYAAAPTERRAALLLLFEAVPPPGEPLTRYWSVAVGGLLKTKLPLTAADVVWMFDRLTATGLMAFTLPLGSLVSMTERMAEAGLLDAAARRSITSFAGQLHEGQSGPIAKHVARLTQVATTSDRVAVRPGEPWSDAVIADVAAMPPAERASWAILIEHAGRATGGKPTASWTAAASAMAAAIDPTDFSRCLAAWLSRVATPRPAGPATRTGGDDGGWRINPLNGNVLKGLAWTATHVPTADVARTLAGLCLTSLKKLPGVGPRLPAVANAAVYALAAMGTGPALGQLARLQSAVRFRTTLNQIEKALDATAARLNLTRDDLAELAVPAYGFGTGGVLAEQLGSARVEQRIVADGVATTWTNDKGKTVKAPPADVKRDHAGRLKELKGSAADAEAMLTAQRNRLDSLMAVPRTWRLADWRPRYLDHPLVGTLARRLIWAVDGVPVLFDADGNAADVAGRPVPIGDAAELALWHPVGRPVGEVVAWRQRLEDAGVTQPFKQAHREVYLLTDAERHTVTYSNRFAGHVVRHHQFNALAAARGWRHKLRLMVDDSYPPATRDLPAFGLRAEYWVEGAGGDYGTDTTAAGAFLRLTTDQVRFYRADAAENHARASGGGYRGRAAPAEPVSLADVPPRVLSEVMRDVDLFVGVASVGNDPTWQDGGPGGRYRDYWQGYSFGELSATAQTRRDVLTRLLPRLKISDRCTLAERFLVVRGTRRTYKIHLGSGNILMEPNDQYLCIVPARGAAGGGDVFLPFEGDGTLSVVLSKAFLLAADDRITDPTITRQIGPD